MTAAFVVYREPNRSEKTLINRALDRWGVFEALSREIFLIHEKMINHINKDNNNTKLKTVCLLTQDLAAVTLKTSPLFAGLAIGYLRKQFMPSMAGADLFARSDIRNKRYYVKVNENAEKLILYGRDVLAASVVEASEELIENDLVIMVNTMDEAIGIGRTRYPGKLIWKKGNIVAITTIMDAGYYLREEG